MWVRQGLDRVVAASPAETAARFGWLRAVGSCNAYLAIRARAGLGARVVEAAVTDGSLCEVPAARGCVYWVPREHVGLALWLARETGGDAPMREAERHLGVGRDEIAALGERVLDVLRSGPADARALGTALEGHIRHLGAEGKKRGQTTTLPLAVTRLQLTGAIRRIPRDGRLDGQSNRFALAEPVFPPADPVTELAGLYGKWYGAAGSATFRSWSGLSAKALTHVTFAFEADPEPEPANRVHFLASLDPWVLAQAGLPDDHVVARDGVAIGRWIYDTETKEIVTDATLDDPVETAKQDAERYVRDELGDARSFSLDSLKSRTPRLAALRAAR